MRVELAALTEYAAHSASDIGLLIRLEVLQHMADRNPINGFVYVLLWAMFTCIGLCRSGSPC